MSQHDEFDELEAEVREAGWSWRGRPEVRRRSLDVGAGVVFSMLEWGPPGAAEIVALHGGLQNAHAWDRLAVASGRPLLAVDLAGHGRSSLVPWALDPRRQGESLAPLLEAAAAEARLVAGMSLGGLAAICLAANRPELVPQLCVIDVTPGVVAGRRSPPALLALMRIESFASFEEIVDGVAAALSTRSRAALARNLRHNTHQRADGRWVWTAASSLTEEDPGAGATDDLTPRQLYLSIWDELGQVTCPLTVVRGGRSPVVTQDDLDEVRRLQPDAQVVVIERAGHSVQGSQPAALATLFDELLARQPPGAGSAQSEDGRGAASLGGSG
jgi:pimeloyl-ACP methyl ester carboxylesterase